MTKADQWRAKSRTAAAEEAIDLKLPSGMVIRARRPGPAYLAGLGRLPLSLATTVQQQDGEPLIADAAPENDVVEFARTIRELLVYCVVEPGISLTPGPEEIHPREIAGDDLQYILSWAMRGSEAVSLETFRAQRSNGRAGGDGTHVPPASISTAGNLRSGNGAQLRPRGGRRNASAQKRG